jgi:ELWxxDGT repeat protein
MRPRFALLLTACSLGSLPAFADPIPATLVKNIHAGAGGGVSSPFIYADVGGVALFTAQTIETGSELWRSDGTEAGTALVKDIRVGSADGALSYPTLVDGTLFFVASTDGSGSQLWMSGSHLWKSDGTAAGTIQVSDFVISPEHLTNVNGTLFFVGRDEACAELWKSDGTAAGTVRVKDIYPGPGCSMTLSTGAALVNMNGTLYFPANDGAHGTELWKSDGTEAGTVLVRTCARAARPRTRYARRT